MMGSLLLFLCILQSVFGAYYCGLCGNSSLTCTEQLWPKSNKSEDACRMLYYPKNSEECKNKDFSTNYTYHDYGYVKLQPFVDKSRTVMNVSLHDIKWTIFRMRFMWLQKFSMCRDFHIKETEIIPSSSVLFYDCPFAKAVYESTILEFNYDYGHENNLVSKKFLMYVPKHESIDDERIRNFTLFTYLDVSNLNKLILRIKKAPEHLNITYYEVKVMRTVGDQTELLIDENISNFTSVFGEYHFPYKTNGVHGKYAFEVKYCNDTGNCGARKTPSVFIPKNTTPQKIAIVSVSTTLIIILLFVLYICKQQCVHEGELFREQQKILLVYSRSSGAHFEVVKAIADFLTTAFNTNVLIDVYGVPLTKTKDPYIWFQDAFASATDVVFLLSPENADSAETIYRNIDNLAIHLLKQQLSERKTNKKFSVLIFPYSQNPVPIELMCLKQFYFKKDFEKFLDFLFRKSICQKLEECVHVMKTGDLAKVHEAVAAAEKALSKNNSSETKKDIPEYKLQKDESRIIRIENTYVPSENIEDQQFPFDVHRLLDGENVFDSDVPEDDCNTFDVHDLNLEGD